VCVVVDDSNTSRATEQQLRSSSNKDTSLFLGGSVKTKVKRQHTKQDNILDQSTRQSIKMAAVLCKSLGSLCTSCGQCVTLPFRACGQVCGAACENCVKVFASPFTPYILTTLALNLPPVIWGLRSAVSQVRQQQFDCHGERWLWTYAVLSFMHIVASIYISSRIQDSSCDDHDDDGYDEHMDGVKVEMPMATTGTQNESANVAKARATAAPTPSPLQAPYHAYEESVDEAEKGSGTMKNTAAQAASTLVRIATAATAAFPPSNNNNNSSAARAAAAPFDTTDDGRAGKSNSIQRLKQVLCYDVGVALYILVIIFWFVWQSYGISQVLFAPRNDDYDNSAEICDSVGTWVILSIMCGFLYIMLVCVAFACSFLCLRY
jgi:hypothetical protein